MSGHLKHGERGQAIAETVIFLPLFLFVLFGIIWAVQAAVQYERVESGVRLAGLVSQRTNPYNDYSLYSMYSQLGSTTIPAQSCVLTNITDPLSDAAPTYTSASTTTASAPFWSPYSTPTTSCAEAAVIGAGTGTTGTITISQDLLMILQEPRVISVVQVPSSLVHALGSATSPTATGNFFKQVGINVVLACYPTLNTQIAASLEPLSAGATTSATTPAALGDTVSPQSIPLNPSCITPNL